MCIKSLLINSIESRFKSNCIINEIEKKFIASAIKQAKKKYQHETWTDSDNTEFEVYKIVADFKVYDVELPKIKVYFWFTATKSNNLLKKHFDRIDKFKSESNNRTWFEECNLKKPLWQMRVYSVDIDTIVNNELNLIMPSK